MHADTFESRIAGIPCIVKVTYYVPPMPGGAEPPQREDWEFEILNRRGYRANWLAEKLSPDDEWRLLDEFRTLREAGGW